MRLAVRSTVVASALAIAAIAAPAASARFDLGPHSRVYDVNPSTGYAIPVAPPQAQTRRAPVPRCIPTPTSRLEAERRWRAAGSRIRRRPRRWAIERLKEQALANHVPPNGRQSNADVNTTANPVAAPCTHTQGTGQRLRRVTPRSVRGSSRHSPC